MSAQGASVTADCEVVLDYVARTGESPFWSVSEQRLYWIDIEQPALHRFDPAAGQDEQWLMPAQIGCYAVDADGSRVILGLRCGVYELRLRTGALRELAPAPFDSSLFRFNDGGCDRAGRFWLGTMFDPQDPQRKPEKLKGECHSYSEAEGLIAQDDRAVIANGLAWDPAGRTVYIAHSEKGIIYAFDYDPQVGRLGRRRIFATVPGRLGVPDGGAVDSQGGYWSAINGGGRLRRFHPDGRHDRDVYLPVSLPTMCAFGGADLETAYVTSQSDRLTAKQRAAEPFAGRLLRLGLGVRGLPMAAFGVA